MQRNRSRKRTQQIATAPRGSGSVAVQPALLRRRKWLFRIVSVVLAPLLVVGGLELLVRLLGGGFDPHFFRQVKIGGKDVFVSNSDFGLRFFPRSLARAPEPVVMPVTKAAGTFRIFIFGESAALGDPRPNYGVGYYLQVLLSERFPQARFEVVNTGMTAINSHVILPIAKECARRDGDLWIVYMGNNEMVGPFGAATVFGAQSPPRWLIKTQVELKQLRLLQWLDDAAQKLRSSKAQNASWRGMEMFTQNQVPPDDPRRERVRKNFEKNLHDILAAGLDSGAKVVLSTVAVNLRDCPPFGTVSDKDMDPSSRKDFENLLQEGTRAEAERRFADAQSDFQRASKLCPQSAEVQFRLGTCYLRLTNTAAARSAFLRAVDLDTLPFRTDSHMNDSIRAAAREFASESLRLCDAAEVFAGASAEGIPGDDLLYEHVHLNPTGNYVLARAWAGEVEKLLSPEMKRGARPDWIPEANCEELLGMTDWNRVSILEDILRRVQHPPFSAQSGNARQVARLRVEIDQLRRRLTPEAAVQARKIYERALWRAPEDFCLHENYAEFLEAVHDSNLAVAERERVCELLPCYYFPHYTLGIDLKEAGRLAEARKSLLKAETIKPNEADVWLELGIVSARQNDWDAARQQLEEARRFGPDDPQIRLYLGEVHWKLGQRTEALADLREAIRLAPDDWQPHYRLASDLAQEGNLTEAEAEFSEALRLNPSNVRTKIALASVLLSLGHEPQALRQLDEVLSIEPNNAAAAELRRRIGGM